MPGLSLCTDLPYNPELIDSASGTEASNMSPVTIEIRTGKGGTMYGI